MLSHQTELRRDNVRGERLEIAGGCGGGVHWAGGRVRFCAVADFGNVMQRLGFLTPLRMTEATAAPAHWNTMYRTPRSSEILLVRNMARETAGLMWPPAAEVIKPCEKIVAEHEHGFSGAWSRVLPDILVGVGGWVGGRESGEGPLERMPWGVLSRIDFAVQGGKQRILLQMLARSGISPPPPFLKCRVCAARDRS